MILNQITFLCSNFVGLKYIYEFSWIVSNVLSCFKILWLCYLIYTENEHFFLPKTGKTSLVPIIIKRRLLKNIKTIEAVIFLKKWDRSRDVNLERY